MWKLKLASKVVGGSKNPLENKELKFARWVRYGGFFVAGAYFLLGVIGVFVTPLWTGFYAIAASLPIMIIELPLAVGNPMVKLLTIFNDFRFRAPVYLILALPTFFNSATILAGVFSIIECLAYLFCWFRGEEGEPVKSILAAQEEPAGSTAATGGKKAEKNKGAPLAAQGAPHGSMVALEEKV